MMEMITAIPIDAAQARIYEHGWQSWSPTTTYRIGERPYRPTSERNRRMGYRMDVRQPVDAYQGEGLLAVQPGAHEPVTIVAAPDGRVAVPSIRAEVLGGRVIVSSDGDVDVTSDTGPGGIDGALARWADGLVAKWSLPPVRPAPTTWCSWYYYLHDVKETDIEENLAAIETHDLPVDVVQLDDGYQAEIGEWLTLSGRFTSLHEMVRRIHHAGHRAGVWVAPFLVGNISELAAEHPDWLVSCDDKPVDPGHNWGQRLAVLDPTHPGAEAYLRDVFETLRGVGFDFFKIDFVYAGAAPGRRHADTTALAAYRHGLEVIRSSIGDAYLLGCGAPILPSIGLVDAMRISPDTAPYYEPKDGDLSQPSSRAAALSGVGRAFMHGRLWVNDPDCLIVHPATGQRSAWAEHVDRWGGLRSSSDRIIELDEWGLETTRRLLAGPVPGTLIPS